MVEESEDGMSNEEFWCIWFNSSQGWRTVFDDGSTLGPFSNIYYASNAAYKRFGMTEADFFIESENGEYYHFARDVSENPIYEGEGG